MKVHQACLDLRLLMFQFLIGSMKAGDGDIKINLDYVSIPYRFNERSRPTLFISQFNCVSIPYRFNERNLGGESA